LSSRDPASQSFAIATIDVLENFVSGSPAPDAGVFVALDDQDDGQGVVFSQIRGSGTVKEPPLHGLTLEQGLRQFLDWSEAQRVLQNIPVETPRILVFSSHGAAGFGLTTEELQAVSEGRLDSVLDEVRSQFAEVAEAAAAADSKPGAKVTTGFYVPNERYLERIRAKLAAAEFSALDEMEPGRLVSRLLTLDAVRRQPSREETGVTLLAAGVNAADRLSVRRFRNALVDWQGVGGIPPLDIVILQACSLGMPEIAFELRDAAQAVILCPVLLEGRFHLQEALSAASAGSASRQPGSFAEFAAAEILAQEEIARTSLSTSTPTAVLAARTDDNQWSVFSGLLSRLSTALLAEFDHDEQSTRAALRQIQEGIACRQGGNVCACETLDLVFLLKGLADRFSGDFAILHSEAAHAQGHVLIDEFAHPAVLSACHSQGFAVYLPASRDKLFDSYDPSHADGFDLLAATRWHSVLDRYLPAAAPV
jgi:hypothetical protein